MTATHSTQLEGVRRAIEDGERFAIACHVEPDPDCLGSMLALDWALRQLGKESIPISPDPVPVGLRFLPGADRILSPQEVKHAALWTPVVVDTEVGRTGALSETWSSLPNLINIDHHVTNPGTGSVNWVQPSAAATGEMIFDLIGQMDLALDSDVATCLYAAIAGDTGSFRFSNTSARVLEIASALVGKGARPEAISQALYDTRSWEYVRLLERVLATLERDQSGAVAWLSVTARMIKECNARSDEAEGFIQYARIIDGVEVAVLFREADPDRTRVSFRSKRYIDVSRVAKAFGGGGHPRAAGCTLALPIENAKPTVLEFVREVLQEAGRR